MVGCHAVRRVVARLCGYQSQTDSADHAGDALQQ